MLKWWMTAAYSDAAHAEILYGHSLLERWSRVLPERILGEDLGDWLEVINERVAEGKSTTLHVIAAILCTAVNAVAYKLTALGRKHAR